MSNYYLVSVVADLVKYWAIVKIALNGFKISEDGYSAIHYALLILLFFACHKLGKVCIKAHEHFNPSSE